MRQELIKNYIDQLRASFGRLKPLASEEVLQQLYAARDYAGMLGHISAVLRLDVNLRLGLVNSGGPNAPAWVAVPVNLPLIGTPQFRQVTVSVYVRKTYINDSPFEALVCSFAHELCHIILNGVRHPLRYEEMAVDLTAMLLGFRDFYVTGCTFAQAVTTEHQRLAGYEAYLVKSVGYLTREEVGYAAEYMSRQ